MNSEQVYEILSTGYCDETKNSDNKVSKTIEILSTFSKKFPEKYLECLKDLNDVEIYGMLTFGLAIFVSNIELNKKYKEEIIDLLLDFTPKEIMHFLDYVNSRYFGNCNDNKIKNIIKDIMESWSQEDIKEFHISYPKQLLFMLKTFNPKYSEEEENLVKQILSI